MKCQDCGEILPLKVLHSNAGYYVGRWCNNCGPYSRESGYFKDSKSAELELDIIKHPYDKNGKERWS